MDHELLIQTECAVFFEENPYALETVESLADRLGRKAEHLRPVLDQLVQRLIVARVASGGQTLYRYSQPDATVIG